MHLLLFATLSGLWELCGGHVTVGTVLGIVAAYVVGEKTKNVLLAFATYFVVAILFWMVADWIWGPYAVLSTTEFPHY